MLETEHNITDPEPSRMETWLFENELGFYFRAEYRFRPTPRIYAGIAGNSHQVTICIDYQLTIDDLRDENGNI